MTDAAGNPVTGLTGVSVSAARRDCTSGAPSDIVEEYAPTGSGLQDLGNGSYQLNWKTASTYAKSCRTLRLDIGDGVTHDANFQFVR